MTAAAGSRRRGEAKAPLPDGRTSHRDARGAPRPVWRPRKWRTAGRLVEGVEAAVHAVKNSYYEAPEELAAAYADHIVQEHVFLDGNKRTGAAAMLTFLQANAAAVAIPPEELASMMIDLQQRSEAGEDASRLIASVASVLASRRPRHKQRGT